MSAKIKSCVEAQVVEPKVGFRAVQKKAYLFIILEPRTGHTQIPELHTLSY